MFSDACTLPVGVVNELWDGVCEGFRIVDDVDIPSYECSNYNSILNGDFERQMSDIILTDLESGGITQVVDKPHCVHSMGGVEKSDGSLRPITDCSMPEKISINNYMDTTCKKFNYKSVDNLTEMLSENEFMCVTDIASAFRSVSIFPDHRKYQGLAWEVDGEKMYFEGNRLTFGLKCAPYIFNLLSLLIVDMPESLCISRIVNYLDDFAIVESTEDECKKSQQGLVSILRRVGFDISWSKIESPTRRVKFLGIIIDSVEMSLSLPLCKVAKLLEGIIRIESNGRATKKDLECIAGHMAHCSCVIKGGRTFSRRVCDLCNNTARRSVTALTESLLADFAWWKSFCAVFNPFHPIRPYMASRQPLPIMMAIFLGYLWTVFHIFNL